MTKKLVKKISDKLSKVSDSFSINMYDNGYMLEISGRGQDEDWASAKIMCSTVEELVELVKEAATMERE
jgi:hypothetical protein